ncbi:peptidase [Rouxiella sp. S1S-2]|nr:peptidase [Rouxiella sp. S1S-2]
MFKRLTYLPVRIGRSLSRLCSKLTPARYSLFMLPLLVACSSTITQYVKVPATPIPASLLAQCEASPPPDDPLTYGGSVLWNELLLTDLQSCNAQISGIKQIENTKGFN